MPEWPRKLVWVDGLAALFAGMLVLSLRGLLSDFYGLSRELLTFVGTVNVGYSVLGLTLGLLRRRPAALLRLLIVANSLWAAVCVALAVRVFPTATIFGLCHVIGEGIFVGGLALLEWRYRRAILAEVL
jgi:hypothetical protein